jgi:hypothetical protein
MDINGEDVDWIHLVQEYSPAAGFCDQKKTTNPTESRRQDNTIVK